MAPKDIKITDHMDTIRQQVNQTMAPATDPHPLIEADVKKVLNIRRDRFARFAAKNTYRPIASPLQMLDRPAMAHSATASGAPAFRPHAKPMLFAYKDAANPMVVAGDISNRSGGLPGSQDPLIKCAFLLVECKLKKEIFDLARAQFGEIILRRAFVLVGANLLRLRLQCRLENNIEGAASLQRLFVRLLFQMPPGSTIAMSSVPPDGFIGTLEAHAARCLDAAALSAMWRLPKAAQSAQQQRQLVQRAITGNPALQERPLHEEEYIVYLSAAVALESDFWNLMPDDGVKLLRAILARCRELTPTQHCNPQQEFCDGILYLIIKSERLEALPIVADEAASVSRKILAKESPYLIWAARESSLQVVKKLLDLGLDPNVCHPGDTFCHSAFSCGRVPLIAALLNREITDDDAVKMASALLAKGAKPFRSSDAFNADGRFRFESHDAKLATQIFGLKHRWDAFEAQNPSIYVRRGENFVANINNLLNLLSSTSSLILCGAPSVGGHEVMKLLSQAFQMLLDEHVLVLQSCSRLFQFISQSGELFADLEIESRPYMAADPILAEGFAPMAFAGKTVARTPESLRLRLEIWAQAAQKVCASPLTLAIERDTSAAKPPLDWISDLADQLAGRDDRISGGLAAIYIVRGRAKEALALLKSTLQGDVRETGLAFLMAIDELEKNPTSEQAQNLTALADHCLTCCDNDETAAVCAEMALRGKSTVWLGRLLDSVIEHQSTLLQLERLTQRCENLAHIAVDSPEKSLKLFCGKLPSKWLTAWMKQQDEHGDTPLHRAARAGYQQTSCLIKAIPPQDMQALLAVANESQRTPALEALAQGKTQTFVYLLRLCNQGSINEALAQALTSRRGLLTKKLMTTLLSHGPCSKVVRAQATYLARRLARLHDHESLETLLRSCKAEVATALPQRANVLHAVAQADAFHIFKVMEKYLSKAQLQALATAEDRHGLRAAQYATGSDLSMALAHLAPLRQGQKLQSGLNSDIPWSKLRQACRNVAKQDNDVGLNKAISIFCERADKALVVAANDDEAQARIYEFAWEVIDHTDRAPPSIAVRMGLHLAMHRPEITSEALRARAQLTASGATKFELEGGLTFLKGRQKAIEQIHAVSFLPGQRLVLDIPCERLAASGFIKSGSHLSPVKCANSLRTVFCCDHHGRPVLITAYPHAF